MPTFAQSSFSRGEISPAMYGRVDVASYEVALRTARNFIIHPQGGRPRTFDPAALKTKMMGPLRGAKRGWGHTIILERALFIGFDQTPERRGMMIVVGPDGTDGTG